MNRLAAQQDELLSLSHRLRDELLGAFTDADLEYRPGGEALSVRALLLEHGTFQAAYTRAFRAYRLRFDLPAPQGLEDLGALRAWFAQLDTDLREALHALSDEDLARPVDRGGRYAPPVQVTFHTYRETVLVLAAKGSVYLRALGRPLPPMLLGWVG